MNRVLDEVRTFLKAKALHFSLDSLGHLSPDLLERIQSRRLGVELPDYFNNTETIFIHIPKAAGSSFSMGFYGRQVLHVPAVTWREVSPKKFAYFFKFTVIRDPIDRFVSAFDFLRGGGAGNHPCDLRDAKELIQGAELNEWVELLWTSMLQAKIRDHVHFRPQSDWICDEKSNCLMDMVVPLPFVEEGYRLIAERIGAEPTLPRVNQHREEKSVPNATTKKLLELYYAKDRQLYLKALENWPSVRDAFTGS
jgi:hypothetical protein